MSMADQDHGIPARLRAARTQQTLGIEALARELKLPRTVLEAMENGDWARLGAPVYAHRLLALYAGRLGVEVDAGEVSAWLPAPQLRSQVPAARFEGFSDFLSRNLGYLAGTALVVPLIIGAFAFLPSAPTEYHALDPLPGAFPEAALATVGAEASLPVAEPPAAAAPEPSTRTVAAGLAPVLRGADVGSVDLRFTGDSWIEVFDREGEAIDRILARAGEDRQYRLAEVGRITIGNVDATEVRVNGSNVNLDAVRAANVARFALSSDGSIEAITR